MEFSAAVLNLNAVLPELVLCLFLCGALIYDMFVPQAESRKAAGSLALSGILTALLIVGLQLWLELPHYNVLYFGGLLILDKLALVFKLIIFLGAAISFIFSLLSDELKPFRFGEYGALLLGATIGASLLSSANNIVIFVLAIETLSLCSYVLAGYLKHERFSAEAGLKYTLFGAVASGVMLFGLSYLYGLSTSLDLTRCMSNLAPALLRQRDALAAYLALALVLSGIGFKIAMLPFHFWCPDTYQGAPTPVTAFLSVVSKTAGFAALSRILAPLIASEHFPRFVQNGWPGGLQMLLGVSAITTMTYGNLTAIKQTNVKRLLAYSAIAHAGYLLMAAAAVREPAFEAMMLYLFIYLFMNLGAFWVVIALGDRVRSFEIEDFKGAAYMAPVLFAVLFVCLVSLTGIPPTAGFSAKFQLFSVVVGAGLDAMPGSQVLNVTAGFFFALALIGVLNSVISLFYYMRVARVMVFEKPSPESKIQAGLADNLIAVLLCVPVLILLDFEPVSFLVKGALQPLKAGLASLACFLGYV